MKKAYEYYEIPASEDAYRLHSDTVTQNNYY